jgi:hypothetical protein
MATRFRPSGRYVADVGITETLAPGLLGRQRGTGPRTDEGLVNTLNDAEQEDAGEKLPSVLASR